MEKLIDISNVSFKYNNEDYILSDINLSINRGEFVSLLGSNGSGKSTLSKLCNAMLLPTHGSVVVDGLNTIDNNEKYNIRCKVGLVQQNPDNQIVAATVEEDVAFGPENLQLSPDEIRKRVDNSLKSVGMYRYKDSSIYKLSGGEKQKVAISGILAMQPECIILDEPTSMLDPRSRKDVLSTIIKLNKEKKIAIILITHYMNEAILADKVVMMDKGRILIQGTPKEVFSKVELLKEHKFILPEVTELTEILRNNKCNLPRGIYDEDEFILSLKSIIGGRKCL